MRHGHRGRIEPANPRSLVEIVAAAAASAILSSVMNGAPRRICSRGRRHVDGRPRLRSARQRRRERGRNTRRTRKRERGDEEGNGRGRERRSERAGDRAEGARNGGPRDDVSCRSRHGGVKTKPRTSADREGGRLPLSFFPNRFTSAFCLLLLFLHHPLLHLFLPIGRRRCRSAPF